MYINKLGSRSYGYIHPKSFHICVIHLVLERCCFEAVLPKRRLGPVQVNVHEMLISENYSPSLSPKISVVTRSNCSIVMSGGYSVMIMSHGWENLEVGIERWVAGCARKHILPWYGQAALYVMFFYQGAGLGMDRSATTAVRVWHWAPGGFFKIV